MHLAWRNLDPDEPSLEHLRLTPWMQAEGTVVGVAGGRPYTLAYSMGISANGHPDAVRIGVAGGEILALRRLPTGEWTDGVGLALPDLRGCTDIDLRVTPFTNTLPLRRLRLKPGEGGDLLAVWVDVPTLEIRVARQRYTRMDDTIYRYEDLDSGYLNEVTVDGEGLVTLYPGAFGRLT